MIRTSSALFWFGLTIAASVALYHTCNRVQDLNQQLHGLNAAIDAQQQSLHVLKAEWVYLANPARIEIAAHKHLALRPTSPQQVTQLEDLAEALPTRSEAMATVAVNATPIASVRSSLTASPMRTIASTSAHKTDAVVATSDTTHIKTHMTMQRTASAQPLPDSIGALLNELSSHP